MSVPDRIKKLLDQSPKSYTGIDYVYVHENQVNLDIHFLVSPFSLQAPLNDLTPEKIHIYRLSGAPQVSVTGLQWNDETLQLTTDHPGDFALFKLFIEDDRIDPYFNNITFSFKANCKSDLDCRPAKYECPPDKKNDFPVDYLARDFWSFRQALLDFASQRYPHWEEHLEADTGVMLAEIMSAVGDELAYYQDRIAREGYLETATQRRSLRRHARLVDYDIHDGLGSSGWIDITVKNGNGDVPAGMNVWAIADNGHKLEYEVGKGLDEIIAGNTYHVDYNWNSFKPHLWNEDDTCLRVNTTELYIEGHHHAALPRGKWILLKTSPSDRTIPARNHLVQLITSENTEDPLVSKDITRLVWKKEQALPFEIDLTILEVRGNLVPITAGKKEEKWFIISADPEQTDPLPAAPENISRAVERQGPDGSTAYLYSLPGSDSNPLVWLGHDPKTARPEIQLKEIKFDNLTNQWIEGSKWDYKRALLGVLASQGNQDHFTFDDGTWKRVVSYERSGEEIVHIDYASNGGTTIRFGDGEFGKIPAKKTVFQVEYRTGNGKQSNITAGKIINFDTGFQFIQSVINPIAAQGGIDQETPEEIKQSAPEAFRAISFRAVRPEDYAEAAERLDWVQKAGAAFRWTGSWLTAFVTPDPIDTDTLSEVRRSELINHLDRFRQAGRDTYVLNPVYANLDLEITICTAPDAFPGEVKERVLEVLVGKNGISLKAYFSPGNFTFGTPLNRPAIEAAIQNVTGVRAVAGMRLRRRGWFDWRDFTELSYEIGRNVIVRIENNPLYPDRGSLKLIMKGGA